MSASESRASSSDREIVTERVVDAPRERVWQVWTDPEHLRQWWGPTGFATTTQAIDVRVGGQWRYVMHGPDGRDYPNLITYLELNEPARLVYKHGGEVDLEPVNFTTTVTFEELPGVAPRTRVTMRAVFPSSRAREFVIREYNAIEGGKQTIARLGEYAASLQRVGTGASAPFVLRRVLRAPRDLVWRLWTEREHVAQWFGPQGCRITHCELDLRPGGTLLYCMSFPAGEDMWGKWVFREIAAPERLSFVVSFSDRDGGTCRHQLHEGWPLQMLSVVTFAEHAGIGKGTVVTVTWTAHDATAAEQRTFDANHESMRQGWGGTFAQLEAYLARL